MENIKKFCVICRRELKEGVIDPKMEFCNEHYFELEEAPEKARIILEVNVRNYKVKELIDFFKSVGEYTKGIDTYGIKIQRLD